MVNASQALKIYDADSKQMQRARLNMLKAGVTAKNRIARELADLLSPLFSENGIIQSSGRNQAILDELERSLPGIFDRYVGQDMSGDVMGILNNRLTDYDKVAKRLGLERAVIGDNIAQFDFIRSKTAIMAESFDTGSVKAINTIQDALTGARYSIERGKLGVNTLKEALIQHAGIAPKYAGTVANSMSMSIDRQVSQEQTKRAGLDKMRYTGSVRQNTRTFCLEWVGQVRSIDFWKDLQNDTGPQPVIEFCGGWNCVHRLLPWSDEWGLD